MSLRMQATRRTLPGLPAAPVTAVLGLGVVGLGYGFVSGVTAG
ncbi:MAG: hypothetical protein QOJ17_953, partial [Rhodospirillaceae bacterium]|nr:hypothetical protein [Rhodospirillaceae bacterium]